MHVIRTKHTANVIAAFPYSHFFPSPGIRFMNTPAKKPYNPSVRPKSQYTPDGTSKKPIASPRIPTIKPGKGPSKNPAKKHTKYEKVIFVLGVTSIFRYEFATTLAAINTARNAVCFAAENDRNVLLNIEKNLPF